MKEYMIEDSAIIMGDANEIKAIYRAILKGWNSGKCHIYPMYSDFPKFSEGRTYGICFTPDADYIHIEMHVISGDTFARMMTQA